MSTVHDDDIFDARADETILACLDLDQPKSFFLYAGAGSGKTRSLVEAIRIVCREQGRRLSLAGQKIGVITYTNAACDEIKQRLEFDPRVEVSTIGVTMTARNSGHAPMRNRGSPGSSCFPIRPRTSQRRKRRSRSEWPILLEIQPGQTVRKRSRRWHLST